MIWKMTQIGLNPKPIYFLVLFQKTMISKMTQVGLNPKPFKFFFSKVSKDDDMENDTNWEKNKNKKLVHLLGVHIPSCAFDLGGDIGSTLVHIHF